MAVTMCLLAVGLGTGAAGPAAPKKPNDPTSIASDCYNPDIGTVQTNIGIDSSVTEVCFESPQLVKYRRR